MKLSRLPSVLVLLAAAIPTLARAHPGHDGDHELVWDFGHFVSHPLATIACATVVGVAAWGVWYLLKSRKARRPSKAGSRAGRR